MSNKKKMWLVILIISILVCIGATIYITMYFLGDNSQEEFMSEASETTSQEVTIESFTKKPEKNTEKETKKVDTHNIDWKKINSTNHDLYAWVFVPNTNIDYPIAQSSEDEYDDFYLDHNVYKDYQFAGTIFSEKLNKKDFSDPVTILYGHNMLNGSMFATLLNFIEEDFFNENEYMYIFQDDRVLTYYIYSAYIYDDRHILNSFDFTNEDVLADYLTYTMNPTSSVAHTRPVELTTDSKILTLSTCTNSEADTRFLVQGVLVNDERTGQYLDLSGYEKQ